MIICIIFFLKASNNLWLCYNEVRLSEKEIHNRVGVTQQLILVIIRVYSSKLHSQVSHIFEFIIKKIWH